MDCNEESNHEESMLDPTLYAINMAEWENFGLQECHINLNPGRLEYQGRHPLAVIRSVFEEIKKIRRDSNDRIREIVEEQFDRIREIVEEQLRLTNKLHSDAVKIIQVELARFNNRNFDSIAGIWSYANTSPTTFTAPLGSAQVIIHIYCSIIFLC
jgi:hypothetical protein